VSNLDAPGESQCSGRELEEQGLPVVIKEQSGAVIITYKRLLMQLSTSLLSH
jgi:hypothetical protein